MRPSLCVALALIVTSFSDAAFTSGAQEETTVPDTPSTGQALFLNLDHKLLELNNDFDEFKEKYWEEGKAQSIELERLAGRLDVQATEYREKTAALENLVNTQNSHLDQSIAIVSLLVSAVGLLFAIFGYLGYVSVRNKATVEARAAAKEWFEEKSHELQGRLDVVEAEVKERASRAKSDIDGKMLIVDAAIQELNESLDKAQIDAGLTREKTEEQVLTKKSSEALQEVSERLKQKPESEYSFQDWNKRAFAAFGTSDYEGAARYWQEAAKSSETKGYAKVKSLSLAAIAYTTAGRKGEAEKLYDIIYSEFFDCKDTNIENEFCKTLLSKSALLQGREQYDEANDIYKEIEQRVAEDSAPERRDLLVRAIVGQLQVSLRQKKLEQTITLSRKARELIGKSDNDTYRAWYAAALVSEGNALQRVGELSRAKSLYEEALKESVSAGESKTKNQHAAALALLRDISMYEGRSEEAIKFAQDSCLVYERCGNDALPAALGMKISLASNLRDAGAHTAVEDLCGEVIRLAREAKDDENVARAYMLMASNSADAQNPEECESYIKLADEVAKASESHRQIFLLNRLAESDIVLMNIKRIMRDGGDPAEELARARSLCALVDEETTITSPACYINRAWISYWENNLDEVSQLLDNALLKGGYSAFYSLGHDMLRQPLDSDEGLRVLLNDAWAKHIALPEISRIIQL